LGKTYSTLVLQDRCGIAEEATAGPLRKEERHIRGKASLEKENNELLLLKL